MLSYVFLVSGLVALLFAGESLVRGAVGMAEKMNIPPLIIGLTIVAFGTSAPELVVSLQAAFKGQGDIAIGNVVGSNIANIMLVLGAPAIFHATDCCSSGARRNLLFMICSSLVFIAISMDGQISRIDALVLLTLLLYFLFQNYRLAQKHKNKAQSTLDGEFGDITGRPTIQLALFVGIGIVGLPIGAGFTIVGASEVARMWGVSDAAIGLTVVAIGTSLPELVAALIAAFHKHSELAIGNVIGSNIFNLLAIMGLTNVITALNVGAELVMPDMWIMIITSVLLVPFVFLRRKITWPIGLAMVITYFGYVIYVLGH